MATTLTPTDTATLTQQLKDTTITALNALIAHNVKGADLIKQGILQAADVKQQAQSFWDELVQILNVLQPLFGLVREWLVSAYNHLVELFDWAKAKWHELFGSK